MSSSRHHGDTSSRKKKKHHPRARSRLEQLAGDKRDDADLLNMNMGSFDNREETEEADDYRMYGHHSKKKKEKETDADRIEKRISKLRANMTSNQREITSPSHKRITYSPEKRADIDDEIESSRDVPPREERKERNERKKERKERSERKSKRRSKTKSDSESESESKELGERTKSKLEELEQRLGTLTKNEEMRKSMKDMSAIENTKEENVKAEEDEKNDKANSSEREKHRSKKKEKSSKSKSKKGERKKKSRKQEGQDDGKYDDEDQKEKTPKNRNSERDIDDAVLTSAALASISVVAPKANPVKDISYTTDEEKYDTVSETEDVDDKAQNDWPQRESTTSNTDKNKDLPEDEVDQQTCPSTGASEEEEDIVLQGKASASVLSTGKKSESSMKSAASENVSAVSSKSKTSLVRSITSRSSRKSAVSSRTTGEASLKSGASSRQGTASSRQSVASSKHSVASSKHSMSSSKKSTASSKKSTASSKRSTASSKKSTASSKVSTASSKKSTASSKRSFKLFKKSSSASKKDEIQEREAFLLAANAEPHASAEDAIKDVFMEEDGVTVNSETASVKSKRSTSGEFQDVATSTGSKEESAKSLTKSPLTGVSKSVSSEKKSSIVDKLLNDTSDFAYDTNNDTRALESPQQSTTSSKKSNRSSHDLSDMSLSSVKVKESSKNAEAEVKKKMYDDDDDEEDIFLMNVNADDVSVEKEVKGHVEVAEDEVEVRRKASDEQQEMQEVAAATAAAAAVAGAAAVATTSLSKDDGSRMSFPSVALGLPSIMEGDETRDSKSSRSFGSQGNLNARSVDTDDSARVAQKLQDLVASGQRLESMISEGTNKSKTRGRESPKKEISALEKLMATKDPESSPVDDDYGSFGADDMSSKPSLFTGEASGDSDFNYEDLLTGTRQKSTTSTTDYDELLKETQRDLSYASRSTTKKTSRNSPSKDDSRKMSRKDSSSTGQASRSSPRNRRTYQRQSSSKVSSRSGRSVSESANEELKTRSVSSRAIKNSQTEETESTIGGGGTDLLCVMQTALDAVFCFAGTGGNNNVSKKSTPEIQSVASATSDPSLNLALSKDIDLDSIAQTSTVSDPTATRTKNAKKKGRYFVVSRAANSNSTDTADNAGVPPIDETKVVGKSSNDNRSPSPTGRKKGGIFSKAKRKFTFIKGKKSSGSMSMTGDWETSSKASVLSKISTRSKISIKSIKSKLSAVSPLKSKKKKKSVMPSRPPMDLIIVDTDGDETAIECKSVAVGHTVDEFDSDSDYGQAFRKNNKKSKNSWNDWEEDPSVISSASI